MTDKKKRDDAVTCEFDGSMAILKQNGQEIASGVLLKNSAMDRLRYTGPSLIAQNSSDIGKPSDKITGLDIYETALRTKQGGFVVDKQSAAGGTCDVELADKRVFTDVPMTFKAAAPAPALK